PKGIIEDKISQTNTIAIIIKRIIISFPKNLELDFFLLGARLKLITFCYVYFF
ncbi:unnamed protein product, partial [marine sediment metagenome]